MKEIANKYSLDFSLYATVQPNVGTIICLAIKKGLCQYNFLVLRLDEEWDQEADNQMEWLFAVKMKKSDFTVFLNDIKIFINTHIIPKQMVFSSDDSIIDKDDLLISFEQKIRFYMSDYKINQAKLKMDRQLATIDQQLEDLRIGLEFITRKYE